MVAMLAAVVALAALQTPTEKSPPGRHGVVTYQGSFKDGATYLMQVPSKWNGTLVLYSHGYVGPGSPNPADDVGDPTTGNYLLSNGYALAGSSYASTGWAVAQALPDQISVLDTFARLVKQPRRTIAWGHSMGGLITAGLIQQYPARFDAALPMCGAVAGGVGSWNSLLNGAFAFNTLVASGTLQVTNITNPTNDYDSAEAALSNAQKTLQGQARLALAAALSDIPDWYDAPAPPAPTDYANQEINQYSWFENAVFYFDFYLRAELEGRAGGNPSFNSGVNYREQLAKSAYGNEVTALYKRAGLNVDADITTLNAAATIAANPAALTYLGDAINLDGKIAVPVLTLHTEGDGVVVNQSESAYKQAVRSADDAARLRQVFVYRAGHCAFTSAEELASLLALVHRLDSGRWDGLQPASLNQAAAILGSAYNPQPPAFATFEPGPFLRTHNGPPP
ncbi:MAG: prolyl oligopeptidase family serine peptidase [Candidatus Eremiobacteraeota bacterium]|nr:prolyl oligopeptidase family serine peptidase [Candidatus Eremiobacteraeota bacterium]